jgi:hypothetical protein
MREWTWYKIVRRERGTVRVLAADPAKPPPYKCLRAFKDRDS